MRTIKLDDRVFEAVRAEILGSPSARRLHRLHAVLLVARGLSCRGAARLLGDSPRAVEYWINLYKTNKSIKIFDEKPPGRPSRLSAEQLAKLRAIVACGPPRPGAGGWRGEDVRAVVARTWGVALGLRQAQRLLARIRPGTGVMRAII